MNELNIKIPLFQSKCMNSSNNLIPIMLNNKVVGIVDNNGEGRFYGRFIRTVCEYDDNMNCTHIELDIDTALDESPVVEIIKNSPPKPQPMKLKTIHEGFGLKEIE